MKKGVKKISKLRRVARMHSVFFLISFGLYVALSAIFTPAFMLADMQTKSKALADETITLVGKVLDSPIEPVVSGEAICSNDNLGIMLNWPNDENSENFDISRDGDILITGTNGPIYIDNQVSINTAYSYVVTAHGPMGPGFAISQPITIATPSECGISNLLPIQKITTFQLQSIEAYAGNPQTTNNQPSFSGLTNIPNAKISIILHSGPAITATTYANNNGYWSWECPVTLALGNHTLYTIATDPNDSTITASDSFQFELISEITAVSPQKDTHDNKDKKKTQEKKQSSFPSDVSLNAIPSTPFSIEVSVKNPEHAVYAGSDLSINIDLLKKTLPFPDKEFDFTYTVLSTDGQIIFENSEKINPTQINSLTKNLAIPILAKAGKYRVIVQTSDGSDFISGEAFFQIKELPLFSAGTTTVSLTQLMQSLGWLSLLFFLFFIILLSIEYYQSRHALFQITENYLRRHGFVTKRKGVGR
ncbi:MAG: Ig-like domain-containing protein [Candidatus Moranbacteria bacterium]|nr:Ig-like domain-containing protein [Candidatus Moranbacteria bacterium]